MGLPSSSFNDRMLDTHTRPGQVGDCRQCEREGNRQRIGPTGDFRGCGTVATLHSPPDLIASLRCSKCRTVATLSSPPHPITSYAYPPRSNWWSMHPETRRGGIGPTSANTMVCIGKPEAALLRPLRHSADVRYLGGICGGGGVQPDGCHWSGCELQFKDK